MTDLSEVRQAIEVLEYISRERARLNEMEKEPRAAIMAALGDSELGTLDGEPVVTYNRTTRKQFDVKSLRKDYPGIAEVYTKVVDGRSLRWVRDE